MNRDEQPLLEVKNITKSFGSLMALNNVSFNIYKGEIVSIIGPNGAGKSTLFNIISGVISPTEGKLWFEGKDITKLPTWKISHLGIGTTYQHLRLFNNMAGFENAMAGAWQFHRCGWVSYMLGLSRAMREEDSIAHGLLKKLAILGILDKRLVPPPFTMTMKDRRLLTIGRAIAGKPKLLLLDEPGAGLNFHEIKELLDHIRRYRQEGMTILLIDHRMEIVMNVSDRIIVLNFGCKIADDFPANIQANKEVLTVYLGE